MKFQKYIQVFNFRMEFHTAGYNVALSTKLIFLIEIFHLL